VLQKPESGCKNWNYAPVMAGAVIIIVTIGRTTSSPDLLFPFLSRSELCFLYQYNRRSLASSPCMGCRTELSVPSLSCKVRTYGRTPTITPVPQEPNLPQASTHMHLRSASYQRSNSSRLQTSTWPSRTSSFRSPKPPAPKSIGMFTQSGGLGAGSVPVMSYGIRRDGDGTSMRCIRCDGD